MPIYNEKVKTVANQIKADANKVLTIVNDIQRLRPDFKAASVTARIAEVRTIATKYGFDLADWRGNDEPKEVEPPVQLELTPEAANGGTEP